MHECKECTEDTVMTLEISEIKCGKNRTLVQILASAAFSVKVAPKRIDIKIYSLTEYAKESRGDFVLPGLETGT